MKSKKNNINQDIDDTLDRQDKIAQKAIFGEKISTAKLSEEELEGAAQRFQAANKHTTPVEFMEEDNASSYRDYDKKYDLDTDSEVESFRQKDEILINKHIMKDVKKEDTIEVEEALVSDKKDSGKKIKVKKDEFQVELEEDRARYEAALNQYYDQLNAKNEADRKKEELRNKTDKELKDELVSNAIQSASVDKVEAQAILDRAGFDIKISDLYSQFMQTNELELKKEFEDDEFEKQIQEMKDLDDF